MQWGVPKIGVISVLASRSGVQQLTTIHPDITVTVGAIDDAVNDGLIFPGLGDSGDRLFGTAPTTEDDQSLLHPSKRKRTLSQSES
jgi:uracil phosphoribosyltransferase